MNYSAKGLGIWRTAVSSLSGLKSSLLKVVRLKKQTPAEIRTKEKARQKGIRREMRGLSNQPDGTRDPRPRDEKGG